MAAEQFVTKPIVLDETYKEGNQKLVDILNNITMAKDKAAEAAASADLAENQYNLAKQQAELSANSANEAGVVAAQLTEYLNTKEELTAPAVDKTLLIEGAAADSKVVGENITTIYGAQDIHEDALMDICGYDKVVDFDWVDGEYVVTEGSGPLGSFKESAGWHRTELIPVLRNQTVLRLNNVMTTSITQLFNCFYDKDKLYISKFLVNASNIVIEIPENAKYYALSTQNTHMWKRHVTDFSLDELKIKTGLDKLLLKKKASYEWKGNLSANSEHNTGYGYAPKDGFKFGLYCEFSSFDSITIQLDAYSPNSITIDSTNVTLKSRSMDDVVLEHGVSLSGHLFVNGICRIPNKIEITISSNGVQNTISGTFSITAYETLCIKNGATDLSNIVFTFGCTKIKADIWAIGDSYFGATNSNRWVYYMYQNGFTKNVLFCGSSGSGAVESTLWLKTLFEQGTPKILIWAQGMNMTSDGDSSPSSTWLNATNAVIDLCNKNDIELILCTIPTVPNYKHEYKNAFVRESGYRYIDFAKAVGADSNGVWYDGMLSSDNVHPTEKGAIALYNMAITSVPELTYEC